MMGQGVTISKATYCIECNAPLILSWQAERGYCDECYQREWIDQTDGPDTDWPENRTEDELDFGRKY